MLMSTETLGLTLVLLTVQWSRMHYLRSQHKTHQCLYPSPPSPGLYTTCCHFQIGLQQCLFFLRILKLNSKHMKRNYLREQKL